MPVHNDLDFFFWPCEQKFFPPYKKKTSTYEKQNRFSIETFSKEALYQFCCLQKLPEQNTNYFCDETKVFIFAIDFLPIRRKQEKKKVKKNSEKKIKMKNIFN